MLPLRRNNTSSPSCSSNQISTETRSCPRRSSPPVLSSVLMSSATARLIDRDHRCGQTETRVPGHREKLNKTEENSRAPTGRSEIVGGIVGVEIEVGQGGVHLQSRRSSRLLKSAHRHDHAGSALYTLKRLTLTTQASLTPALCAPNK